MHRTQILLEEWQYEALRARAARDGVSLSRLVRDLVSAALAPARSSGGRLGEIEGVGEDAGANGEDHNDVLYRAGKAPE